MEIDEKVLESLKTYFEGRDGIAFAFLFGSAARGRVRREGDVDIAVYFKPEKEVEWEAFNKTKMMCSSALSLQAPHYLIAGIQAKL